MKNPCRSQQTQGNGNHGDLNPENATHEQVTGTENRKKLGSDSAKIVRGSGKMGEKPVKIRSYKS